MSPRTRIDLDVNQGPFAQMVHLAADYQRAVRAEDWPAAAGAAHRIEHLAEQVTDDAMVRATKTVSARQLAAGMGLVHGTVNHRLRRAKERAGADRPEQLYLVQRRADHGAEVEFLGLHRTREGAQRRAEHHNEGFTGRVEFSAQVRELPGEWLDDVPNAPTEIEE